MNNRFDVIVMGGGHAGCEAAMAAAGMGSSVLLLTPDLNGLAKMSCNPAVGGIAKGQIVREIDALGGYSGLVTDAATLQFRMLNRSKGPAMWSPRAQCDKQKFSSTWLSTLLSCSKLSIYADFATELLFENGVIAGVRTTTGAIFYARAFVLTAGTFLNGKMYIGTHSFEGGRIGEKASYGISDQLASMGIPTERMKTGTPPRIDIRSIDLSKLVRQEGDAHPERFSFLDVPSAVQAGGSQMDCYLLHTNERVHEILRSGFDRSPLFTGLIHGKGPRYCPSIEDKLRTFAGKDSHQLFLEPEGKSSPEYYLQGFSSSLPLEVQLEAVHAIEGLENAVFFKPAYAVEYDYFDPQYLHHSLRSKVIGNLFLAGQVNGTTGYEEAAAQGIIAGMNAHLFLVEHEPFVLRRDQAYIGVLIDDLINKGVDEPYRMFTSRAEYRILLRQDNADFRLTELSHAVGYASEDRYAAVMKKQEEVARLADFCESYKMRADVVNPVLEAAGSTPLTESKRLSELVSRPELSLAELLEIVPRGTKYSSDVVTSVEIAIKYAGYIEREKLQAQKNNRLEYIKIPADFDFDSLNGLSIECRQKLKRYKPETIAQASRISGVSPADISVLLVYFGR
ncbi:MAG: tRNA uridine-5-carboxymethylaminomethyl(34) synthesis enzyme MnmG [Bacteroidales bacterium]|nr:tRNA uridine-5-carboxymethylaminomethyl(34) synthesis enzyme MnmG [Bacteroidales bacterium]